MSAESASEATLNYTHTDTIALPPSGVESRLAIRRLDWERLKRHVQQCSRQTGPRLAGVYFCLFGISGSAGLTLVPLFYAQGLPAWVVPLYVCVTGFGLLLALTLGALERRLKEVRSSRIEELNIDMREIETAFTEFS